jgi:hypothetical protein
MWRFPFLIYCICELTPAQRTPVLHIVCSVIAFNLTAYILGLPHLASMPVGTMPGSWGWLVQS